MGKQLTLQHCFRAQHLISLHISGLLSKVISSIHLSCSVMSDYLQPH